LLETDNSLFCHGDIPTIHNGYCVSNAVDYSKKNDVLPTILSTELRGQKKIDFSTEHNLTSIHNLIVIVSIFYFFEHLEVSCLKSRSVVHWDCGEIQIFCGVDTPTLHWNAVCALYPYYKSVMHLALPNTLGYL